MFSDLHNLKIDLPILPLLNSIDSLELLATLHLGSSCLLCNKKRFRFKSNLKIHLHTHIKHSISLCEVRSLLCKKQCSNITRGHYHCSECSVISPHSNRIVQHFKKCHTPVSRSHSLDNSHKSGSPRTSLLVDLTDQVYLVLKSKFSNGEPIHVQKLSGSENKYSRCSQDVCENAMDAAKQNGKSELECKHLRRVIIEKDKGTLTSFNLLESDLTSLGLSPQETQCCLSLNDSARQKGTPLVVEWPLADRSRVYFSVFCKDMLIATFNRTFVIFFQKEDKFRCTCPSHEGEDFCVYKIISQIYYKKHKFEHF